MNNAISDIGLCALEPGNPLREVRIQTVLVIDGIHVVLFDGFEATQRSCLRHLIGVGATGDIRWQSGAPTNGDTFTEVTIDEGTLVGFTWLGWRVEIDPLTGKVLGASFVK